MENSIYTGRCLKLEQPCQRETCRLLDICYTFTASTLLFPFKIKNIPEVLNK